MVVLILGYALAKREIAILIDLILIECLAIVFQKFIVYQINYFWFQKKYMIINDVQMENGI